MAHPYVSFRLRLARHGLAQFVESLKSSAYIIVLGFGQLLIGLVAFVALPPMYAASLPVVHALPLLAAHALVMCIPLWLLRERLLPQAVARWMHPLPVPPAQRLRADLLIAGLLAGPLALAYAASGAIWLHAAPDWMQPARAVAAVVLSLLLTWCGSAAILALRARLPRPAAPHAQPWAAAQQAYVQRPARVRWLFFWRRLFWLPFWRDSGVGRFQSVLLLAAAGSTVAWMAAPAGVARALCDVCATTLLIVLTDRGDKAVREHLAALRPVTAAWPTPTQGLARCALRAGARGAAGAGGARAVVRPRARARPVGAHRRPRVPGPRHLCHAGAGGDARLAGAGAGRDRGVFNYCAQRSGK
ncbi:MAG: hypothetical protein V4857_06715 [Pseudomonadota bacterium]